MDWLEVDWLEVDWLEVDWLEVDWLEVDWLEVDWLALVEELVEVWASAGSASARPTRTNAAAQTTMKDRLPPTRGSLASLVLLAAIIARLP